MCTLPLQQTPADNKVDSRMRPQWHDSCNLPLQSFKWQAEVQDAQAGTAQAKAAPKKPSKQDAKGSKEHATDKKAAKALGKQEAKGSKGHSADNNADKASGPKLSAKNAYAFFVQDKRSSVKGT